ncbi:MAG: SNF2-related protein, partial [Myxococcota bacterium]|nr:SNF2-related protein [Myxococcota bacterium]
PETRAFFSLGQGWVLCAPGRLQPLDSTLVASDSAALFDGTRIVPAREAGPWLSDVHRKSGGLVVVRADPDLVVSEQSPTQARLVLRPAGRGLGLSAHFVYQLEYLEQSVPSDDPFPFVVFERPGEEVGLVHRDFDAEGEALDSLEASTGYRVPCSLDLDGSMDFLDQGAARLEGRGWTVEEAAAIPVRPGGALEPRVRVGDSTEWFDLGVSFELEENEIDTAEVLRSWAEGRRWIELEDGRVARLPQDWLDRYGPFLEELAAPKRDAPAGASPGLAKAIALSPLLEFATGPGATYWAEATRRIAAFDALPETPIPTGVQTEVRDYQVMGFRWLLQMGELGLGCCLADEMGLGKTLQALVLLQHLHASPGPPSLVVAPTSVLTGWLLEAGRFAPDLKVRLHRGSDRRLPAAGEEEGPDLVVTSYALLRQDGEEFLARNWRCLVLDEAQYIKTASSQTARVARGLQAERRIAMTGTPLENHLGELWSLLEFLNPGLLGSRTGFARRFVRPIVEEGKPEQWQVLRQRVRPFILRRLKVEVAQELPPRYQRVLYCELGEEQRALYDRVRATYRDSVRRGVAEGSGASFRIHVLEALLRLRQACCDPRLLPFPEAQEVTSSAKIELLLDNLQRAREGGHRTLVFSQWPSLLRLVVQELEARSEDYLFLHGATRNRGALVERWNEPDGPPTFLISLKAGGTGLNLHAADHVVHLDPWWNPAAEDQATDRAHRIGQTRPVLVDRIVARGTVEELILQLQDRKRAVFTQAVDTDRLVAQEMSSEELLAVFEDP